MPDWLVLLIIVSPGLLFLVICLLISEWMDRQDRLDRM